MNNDLITIEVEGQHVAWCNELDEMTQELISFENILSIISSPTNKKNIEHFQNQFIIQKNIIAKLKNQIKRHDFAIEVTRAKPFDSVPSGDLVFHKLISSRIEIQLQILSDLRKEFTLFVEVA